MRTYVAKLGLAALAVAIAQAHTIPTPSGCITTSNITQTMYSTPPYWPECEFDSTETAYPSSVTSTTSVDCHGCQHIHIQVVPAVHCPFEQITAYATVTTPYTVHRTVCMTTPTA